MCELLQEDTVSAGSAVDVLSSPYAPEFDVLLSRTLATAAAEAAISACKLFGYTHTPVLLSTSFIGSRWQQLQHDC